MQSFVQPLLLKKLRNLLLALTVAAVIGGSLYYAIGVHFVYFYLAQYTPIGIVFTLLILPAMALALVSIPQQRSRRIQNDSPSSVALAFGAVLFAIALFYAPIGWMALLTMGVGQVRSQVNGELNGVSTYVGHVRKGCDQEGTIRIAAESGIICLEGLGSLPRVSGPVLIEGRESSFGFLVQKIVTQ